MSTYDFLLVLVLVFALTSCRRFILGFSVGRGVSVGAAVGKGVRVGE